MSKKSSRMFNKYRVSLQEGLYSYMDQLLVTLPSFISYTGQVGVPFLTVLAHHTAVIIGVLPQEAFRVVVAVNVDLGKGVVGGRLFAAFMNACL